MKKSPHRMKHEQHKAVRSAQKMEYAEEEKKMSEEELKKYCTSPKTNKIARGKSNPNKKSHMTSPGEVTWETEPKSIHPEGKRWLQTIQKQTLLVAAKLRHHLQKVFRKKR